MKKSYKIKFGKVAIYEQFDRDALQAGFTYSLLDMKYHGLPEEEKKKVNYRLLMGISGTLQAVWAYRHVEGVGLIKTLFELGKRHIIQKLKDGTLAEFEEEFLTSATMPNDPPFDVDKIPNPDGYEETIEMEDATILENSEQLIVGAQVVDTLDNINAQFYDRHNELLFLPREFRSSIEFIRPANTKEEFTYRVASLGQLVNQLNLRKLKELNSNQEAESGSIIQLGIYFKSKNRDVEIAIKIFRELLKVRKAYPVHSDAIEGVLEAHTTLGIEYPVTDFRSSWLKLLQKFLIALQDIQKALKPEDSTSK